MLLPITLGFRKVGSNGCQPSPEEVFLLPIFPILTRSFRRHPMGSVYQNFDLELQQSYFFNRHFSVSPFFGLRNTWINQGYARIIPIRQYASIHDVMPTRISGESARLAGTSSEWHIISMDVFGSFLALYWHRITILPAALRNDGLNEIDRSQHGKNVSDCSRSHGIWLAYEFQPQPQPLAVRLSYEAQYWWKQNLTIDYNSSYNSSCPKRVKISGFHGFTFDTLFDF